MKPYNPLDKKNLGKSVAESLLMSEPFLLGELDGFSGAGIYVIYYTGGFPPYGRLAAESVPPTDMSSPIYVGKATPSGGRKGVIDPEISAKGRKLFGRLNEHKKSIQDSSNLDIKDFWCRYLILDDVWIPLGESLLIESFRPLWNIVVEGFGNHDPGEGRTKGRLSSWDVLHPGRFDPERFAPPKYTQEQILGRISDYWKPKKS